MGYLGNQPTIGAYHKLDAISTVNGQATYNLLLDSVAFTPQSANHMLVVVNGIVQSPTTNYTISGSTITFTGNLVTGDVINEIRVFGDVLNIGTPSDSTVTNAKTNFVSTSSGAGLSIKGDGTTNGTVQLNCSQNSHGVKIASPDHSAGQSYTIKLPTENIAADKIMKVASITGSGTSAVGQMSFVDEPSGGLKLLATNTFSSATGNVTFNNTYINSTYDYYELFYTARPSNDNVNGYFRFLNNSNTQLNSGQYDYVVHDGNGSNAGSANGGNEMGDSHSSVGNASGEGVSGRVYFGNVNETTVPCGFRNEGRCHNNGGTHTVNIVTAGLNEGNASTLVGGIVFQFSSGNIASGTFRLYGVVK